MIATLLRLAGINANAKYEICSWQSGQRNTSWIGPWGGEHIYIYIYYMAISFCRGEGQGVKIPDSKKGVQCWERS